MFRCVNASESVTLNICCQLIVQMHSSCYPAELSTEVETDLLNIQQPRCLLQHYEGIRFEELVQTGGRTSWKIKQNAPPSSVPLVFSTLSLHWDDNRISVSLGFSQHEDQIYTRGVETPDWLLHLTACGGGVGLGTGTTTALVSGSSFLLSSLLWIGLGLLDIISFKPPFHPLHKRKQSASTHAHAAPPPPTSFLLGEKAKSKTGGHCIDFLPLCVNHSVCVCSCVRVCTRQREREWDRQTLPPVISSVNAELLLLIE